MTGLLTLATLMMKQFSYLVAYVKSNAFPQPLADAEERECIAKMAEGDRNARNKLIEHNLRLVAHLVKKFENTGEDQEDLISIGTIGLIKAIESYSLGKGTKLATFAARCIENEILMHLRAKKKTKKEVSLQDPIGTDRDGNDITLIDILSDEEVDLAAQMQLEAEKEQMKQFLHTLDEREREVILARFGLIGNQEERTQRDIAKDLGISRSYVSRIEKRALLKLYHQFNKQKQR